MDPVISHGPTRNPNTHCAWPPHHGCEGFYIPMNRPMMHDNPYISVRNIGGRHRRSIIDELVLSSRDGIVDSTGTGYQGPSDVPARFKQTGPDMSRHEKARRWNANVTTQQSLRYRCSRWMGDESFTKTAEPQGQRRERGEGGTILNK